MPGLRTLGVRGVNLPTLRSESVQPADFAIGGIIGLFPRQFAKAFEINSPNDVATIFRAQTNSAHYGWDAVNGFFANLAGVQATLYLVSHAGYTGAVIDAVTATATLNDTNPTPQGILTLEDGYQGEVAYGEDGNSTGYQIETGNRFSTTVTVDGTVTDTWVTVASVADVYIGDMVEVIASGGGGKTVYVMVTGVDSTTNRISFAAALDAAAYALTGDVVNLPGFRIHTYRKSSTGIVSEVDTKLAAIWLTIFSAVTKYYAPNVFQASPNLIVTVNTTTSPLGENLPAAVGTTAYLASGADGTVPTAATNWAADLQLFNGLPVRLIANPETTDSDTQKAIETYGKSRTDNPKTLYVVPENQTKSQLITIGNSFQRADDVLGYIYAHWLGVTDPFNSTPNAPDRIVPSVGHMMGLWFRCISTKGIHYAPGTIDMPLYGCNSVYGTQFTDDQDRTDLANAGVNCIEDRTKYGIMPRNSFTPSSDSTFMFGNSIMMRDFIKVSAVDSLAGSENTPATLARAKNDGTAILMFMLDLWDHGSTGTVPLGETFAQSEDSQGNPDTYDKHILIEADIVNNPQSSLNAGQRNVYTWFTFPTPTGSLDVGVGIQIPS